MTIALSVKFKKNALPFVKRIQKMLSIWYRQKTRTCRVEGKEMTDRMADKEHCTSVTSRH